MKKRKILVKFTGDFVEDKRFYGKLKEMFNCGLEVDLYLIPGAGKQNTELCVREKIEYMFVGPKGFQRRKVDKRADREKIHLLGKEINAFVRKTLKEYRIFATVIDLDFELNGDFFTQNGDLLAMSLCHNFDEIYAFTLANRDKSQLKEFGIKVINL